MPHANRLAHATSPYLLQHAHNPVHWYEWGPEALERARAEQKPILLSIGYSACHWCHVMAHESFEDPATAELMNRHFVNIKVDREERPDLDDIYMAATVAMNHGQGGWPMTVFLDPDQRPFFAGTYYPPTDAHGRPGFPTLLRRIAELWAGSREKLLEQGERLTAMLREGSAPAPGAVDPAAAVQAAYDTWQRSFDTVWGGFGRAPKFPPAQALRVLLRVAATREEPFALRMATTTLDAMAHGGMYDQVGGGFARYSTDERWLVPHFEKMLYDNALLAVAYLEAFQATGRAAYARIARETLDYAVHEMQSPEGGFWSATDADSEGEEGKFFVWTAAEAREAVGEADAPLVLAWLDITERGNWEGKSIPNTPVPLATLAKRFGLEEREAEARVARGRAALYARRATRVPPGLDDKVLAAWNGLMIGALATGARVLGEPRWRDAAERAAAFVLGTLRREDGGLLRTWRRGTARLDAYLEDHAYLADGLVSLYEAGADERWLREARALVEQVRTRFRAPDGGFFTTGEGHEALVLRPREGHDGATPSANAMAALAMIRLSYHLGEPALREEGVRALEAFGAALAEHPHAFATSLLALDFAARGPVELALVGAAGDPRTGALAAALASRFVPHAIFAHHDPARSASSLPLLAGKELVAGAPALYACRDYACRRPITDAADLDSVLA
jgi:uncharacterized protein YyaL (SSP411 family)